MSTNIKEGNELNQVNEISNADEIDSPLTLLSVDNSKSYLNSTVVSSKTPSNTQTSQRKKLIKKTANRAHWGITAITLALTFLTVFLKGQTDANVLGDNQQNHEISNDQLKNIVKILATLARKTYSPQTDKDIKIIPSDNVDVNLEKINDFLSKRTNTNPTPSQIVN